MDDAVKFMKEAATKSYSKKGEAIVQMNHNAIECGVKEVRKVKVPKEWAKAEDGAVQEMADTGRPEIKDYIENILKPINKQQGDKLPVSTFVENADGTVPLGSAAYEKRGIAVDVPCWLPENCIQCNFCSFVCPHACIRPIIMNEEEVKNAPEGMKMKPATGMPGYQFSMPRGYVTTASDELGRKTVMDLVSDIPARLYPVGRLDKDSEGLLLMTNDGAFAQAVTHPSGGISKLYRVTVQPRADEATILKLSSGVVLDDGTKTMPCAINVVTDEPGRTVMEMTLKEGKNREIRRMCESVGLEVVRLKRNAEGVVKLGMLKPGTYRELTKAEVNGLRAAAA